MIRQRCRVVKLESDITLPRTRGQPAMQRRRECTIVNSSLNIESRLCRHYTVGSNAVGVEEGEILTHFPQQCQLEIRGDGYLLDTMELLF